ncbi:hypothetical protein [Cognatilysobacter tabacisoli]|uniref:hypothetical protein n=1 Tax=Cognatilysobacter tabacisoli TaxID=2315424 RepID=UPI000E6AF147|nr:hypothetical protein [Lysobacter tabacisoli]
MRRRLPPLRSLLSVPLVALLCAPVACSLPAQARPLVDLAVVDRESGQWLPATPHRGRDWIAGAPGHRYSVQLTNTTGERVLVVLSVDGVNAVTGQTAHPSQAGYVLEPWQSTQIHGWRKSMDDVAQFVFTDLPDSYAARTGRPDNVGVIGIAVFTEARSVPYYDAPAPIAGHGSAARESAARGKVSAPPAAAESRAADAMATQGLGTGHGARAWSPVGRTGFDRATRAPVQVREVRYDDPAGLLARGVWPRGHRWPRHDAPRAFPDGFVADPPY